MMQINFIVLLAAAAIPLFTGWFWYSNMVLGNKWKQANGLDDEKLKGGNMPLIFGLTYVFGFFLAMILQFVVIHQWGLVSMLMNEPGFQDGTGQAFEDFTKIVTTYPNRFRTFGHGAFHGFLLGLEFVLPVVGIIGMYERRSWKYIWIHVGYWALTLALMGGVICQWA